MRKLFLFVCTISLFSLYGFSSAFAQAAVAPGLPIIELLQQQVQALLLQVQTLQQQVIELRSELREPGVSSYASTSQITPPVSITYFREELEESIPEFARPFGLGSSGEDVRRLQELLAQDEEIYPEGLVTGYFGSMTERAVRRWQRQNGIEQAGRVGRRSIARLNELIVAGAGISGRMPSGLMRAPGLTERATSSGILSGVSSSTLFVAASSTIATSMESFTTTTPSIAVASTTSFLSPTSTQSSLTSTSSIINVPQALPLTSSGSPYISSPPTAGTTASIAASSTVQSTAATSTTATTTAVATTTILTTTSTAISDQFAISSVLVTVSAAGNVQAPVFSWTTNRLATSYVQLGPKNNPTGWNGSSELATSHSINWNIYLGYFKNSASYIFRVKSTDTNGVTATSDWYIVGTLSSPPSSPMPLAAPLAGPGETTTPVISNVARNGTTFTWTTDGSDTALVEFSPSGGTSGDWYALETSNHSVTVESAFLTGATSYRVKSADFNGNTAVSEWYSLMSSSGTQTVPTYIRADWGTSHATGNYGKVGQHIIFQYPTDSQYSVSTFRLYEKKPGDADFSKVAEWTNSSSTSCDGDVANAKISGVWSLIRGSTCGSWVAYRQQPGSTSWSPGSFSVSSYAQGAYEYYVTAVGSGGTESAPSQKAKMIIMNPLTIVGPTAAESPVSLTPTFSWTNPGGWPTNPVSSAYPLYFVLVSDSPSAANPLWTGSVSNALSKLYGGPALDPAKQYILYVYGLSVIKDTSQAQDYIQYISLPPAIETFQVAENTATSTGMYPSRASFLANLLTSLVSALRELEAMLSR